MKTTQKILLLVTACVAMACTAQGDDRDDRTGSEIADRAEHGEQSVEVKESALSLRPATTCSDNCGCPPDYACLGGSCQLNTFGPHNGSECWEDCQCRNFTPSTPYCVTSHCAATRCYQTISSANVPPGGTTTYGWYAAGAGGVRVVLLGTKNGVPDEIGQNGFPTLSGSAGLTNAPGSAGRYVRHISLRNASDVEICRSDDVTIIFQ